jgi:hypothetical protein
MSHTAFVEFEVATFTEFLSEEEVKYREQYMGRKVEPTVTHYRKLRLTTRERDVDSLIDRMTAGPGVFLSELSCSADCTMCKRGGRSPYI